MLGMKQDYQLNKKMSLAVAIPNSLFSDSSSSPVEVMELRPCIFEGNKIY